MIMKSSVDESAGRPEHALNTHTAMGNTLYNPATSCFLYTNAGDFSFATCSLLPDLKLPNVPLIDVHNMSMILPTSVTNVYSDFVKPVVQDSLY